MTKIKNTKKGMAKKTLSISLAVAMLATSNVPVWAAEFTDGSDATFTSEAPAEDIVEEVPEVEAPAEEDTQDAKDISAPKSTMKIHESGWANDITVDGRIYDKNGKEVKEFQFAWVVDGLIGSEKGSDYGISTDGTVAPYAVTSNDIGKEVELHIFDVNTDPVIGNADYVFKTNTVTVSKVNVDLNSKSKKMTVSALGKEDIKHVLVYTGKTQYYDEIGGGITAYAEFDHTTLSGAGDFEYSTTIKEGNGVDIGSVYTVVATPKDSSKYTGSLNYDYTIVAKDFKDGDLSVKLDKKYEYTGNVIKPAVGDVTVKENLKNTVLDSDRVVKNVTALANDKDDEGNLLNKIGTGWADVTLHNVPNFTEDSLSGKGFSVNFEVVARDLSNVDVVIDAIAYTGEVLEDNDDRFVNKIHFFDKETGEELNLDMFNDYTIHVAGKPSAGTKTYNIELKANNENTKNYKSLTFTLGNEDFSSQGYCLTDAAIDEIEKPESYIGKDITKDITKIAFEDEEGKKIITRKL